MFKKICLGALILTATPALAQDKAEIDFARNVLEFLQPKSFEHDREYCGYLAYDADDNLVATPARKGRRDSCMPAEPDENLYVFASYHTHGAFDYDAPAEFPSSTDVIGDNEEGIDGYISTPGGRLWYVDGEAMTVRQLCSVGCLSSDPNFIAGLDGEIAHTYTIDQLKEWEGE